MGDALTSSGVHRDQPAKQIEADTIDGAEPASSQSPAPSPVLAPQTSAPDYPELVTVERRHYQIGGEIAKGGMGRVLAARDLRLGRPVAIKELLPRNRDMARRFEREARITARLQHPAIIHVYEAGVWAGGEPFYAMTKVSGVSLDKVVAERKTLAERMSLIPNVIAVADALAYAHNENVIHRDLKPANVLVGAFGETVVIDWGLAKDLGTPIDPLESLAMRVRPAPDDTNVGAIVGTPAYMPPEQARGASVDQRADVYSLGALLYHVLVGKPPYTGTSSLDVVEQVKSSAPPPVQEREPGAPADLVAIVAKAMARARDERYENADELAHDLKRFQTGQLVAARHYTTPQLFWRWVKRYRVPVAIGLVAIAALAVIGTVSISRVLQEQAKDQRRRNELLAERGRNDLLAGQAGRALSTLVEAARDSEPDPARNFMIADAIRPFEAEVRAFDGIGPRGAVAYSLDGASIITLGADHTIRLARANETIQLGRHPGVRRVAFDGTRIVTASDDHVIRIHPLTGGKPLELRGHTGEILDLDISDDGKLLATASADGTARIWDLLRGIPLVHNGRESMQRCHGGTEATHVKFAPQSHVIVSASNDHALCRWNPNTSSQIALVRGHKARINTVRWSADGKYLLTSSDDGTARVWEELGKSVIAPLAHEGNVAITSAEFSHDGARVVTAGADRVARVWELPDLASVADPSTNARWKLVGHLAPLEGAVFAPDDSRIASVGRDGKAKVWDAETGQLLATFEHALPVYLVAFLPEDKLLTAADDGSARVWDIRRGAARQTYPVDSPIHAVALAPDGTLAVGSDDTRIRVWRPSSADPVHVLRDHDGSVFALAFAAQGRLLVSGAEDTTIVWDVETGKRMFTLGPQGGAVRAIAVTGDGTMIATGDDDGVVRRWSARTGTLLRTEVLRVPVRQLAFTPDAALLAAVGSDGHAIAWRAGIPQALPGSNVTAVAFRADGKQLAVATTAGIAVHAITDGVIAEEHVPFEGPTGDVRAIEFTPEGMLVTAGVDGIVKIWDVARGKLVGTREAGGPLDAIAIAANGETVWAGGAGQMARAWDIRVDNRPFHVLVAFQRKHVPWYLDENDVVRSKLGERNGQR